MNQFNIGEFSEVMLDTYFEIKKKKHNEI